MVSIQKLSSANTPEFKQLIKLFNEDDGIARKEISSEDYLKSFLLNESNHVLIALSNEELAGGLIAYELKMYKSETTEMFLFEIGVKAAFRMAGIGTQLITRLKEICVERKIVQMFVLTSDTNTAANLLYKKTAGICGESSNMYSYFFEK